MSTVSIRSVCGLNNAQAVPQARALMCRVGSSHSACAAMVG